MSIIFSTVYLSEKLPQRPIKYANLQRVLKKKICTPFSHFRLLILMFPIFHVKLQESSESNINIARRINNTECPKTKYPQC